MRLILAFTTLLLLYGCSVTPQDVMDWTDNVNAEMLEFQSSNDQLQAEILLEVAKVTGFMDTVSESAMQLTEGLLLTLFGAASATGGLYGVVKLRKKKPEG